MNVWVLSKQKEKSMKRFVGISKKLNNVGSIIASIIYESVEEKKGKSKLLEFLSVFLVMVVITICFVEFGHGRGFYFIDRWYDLFHGIF